MIDHYDWVGGREAMMRFGPDTGPVVVAALPLFEEANRTRTFMVTILRELARLGVASVLPDFPGTGESLTPTEEMTKLGLQEAYEGVVDHLSRERRPCLGMGIRSGTLLDSLGLLFGRWHFAPQNGADLLRELTRIKQMEIGANKPLSELWFFDGSLPEDAPDPPVEIAGNLISPALLIGLTTPFDEPGIPRRVVRLQSDPQPADRHVPGAPLWRRAEPGNDPALAAGLADDIAAWVRACEG